MFRANRTTNGDYEGHPIRGISYVQLPEGWVYTFYRPMIFLDEHLMDDTEFIRVGG